MILYYTGPKHGSVSNIGLSSNVLASWDCSGRWWKGSGEILENFIGFERKTWNLAENLPIFSNKDQSITLFRNDECDWEKALDWRQQDSQNFKLWYLRGGMTDICGFSFSEHPTARQQLSTCAVLIWFITGARQLFLAALLFNFIRKLHPEAKVLESCVSTLQKIAKQQVNPSLPYPAPYFPLLICGPPAEIDVQRKFWNRIPSSHQLPEIRANQRKREIHFKM